MTAPRESHGSSPSASELVVLVHGFGSSRWFLRPLAKHLAGQGYRAVLWGYPSLAQPIANHAGKLRRKLEEWAADPEVARVHLAAHSMGNIVVRAALEQGPPPKLGRFVMLAPPNRGSFVANLFAPLIGWCLPPVAELSERPDSFVNRLAPPEVEFGVIAASRDHLVRVASTHLERQRDHITLPCLHLGLLFRGETHRQVAHFLAEGRFARAA